MHSTRYTIIYIILNTSWSDVDVIKVTFTLPTALINGLSRPNGPFFISFSRKINFIFIFAVEPNAGRDSTLSYLLQVFLNIIGFQENDIFMFN